MGRPPEYFPPAKACLSSPRYPKPEAQAKAARLRLRSRSPFRRRFDLFSRSEIQHYELQIKITGSRAIRFDLKFVGRVIHRRSAPRVRCRARISAEAGIDATTLLPSPGISRRTRASLKGRQCASTIPRSRTALTRRAVNFSRLRYSTGSPSVYYCSTNLFEKRTALSTSMDSSAELVQCASYSGVRIGDGP